LLPSSSGSFLSLSPKLNLFSSLLQNRIKMVLCCAPIPSRVGKLSESFPAIYTSSHLLPGPCHGARKRVRLRPFLPITPSPTLSRARITQSCSLGATTVCIPMACCFFVWAPHQALQYLHSCRITAGSPAHPRWGSHYSPQAPSSLGGEQTCHASDFLYLYLDLEKEG
jgi:hypothetical protein